MKWILLGAVLGGVGVGLGAFGAHGLDRYFVEKYASTAPKTIAGHSVPASWKYLQDYKTGVHYHLAHALAMIAVGLVSLQRPSRWLNAAGVLFLLGILLFSGSLYVLTIAGPDWLGVIWGLVAAVGGTMFLLGWAAFAVAACPCHK